MRFEDPKMTIIKLIWWTELHWYCEDPHEILSKAVKKKKKRAGLTTNYCLIIQSFIIFLQLWCLRFSCESKYFNLVYVFKPVYFFQTILILPNFFFFFFLTNKKGIFLLWGCTHVVKKKMGAWLLEAKKNLVRKQFQYVSFSLSATLLLSFPLYPPLAPRYSPDKVPCTSP